MDNVDDKNKIYFWGMIGFVVIIVLLILLWIYMMFVNRRVTLKVPSTLYLNAENSIVVEADKKYTYEFTANDNNVAYFIARDAEGNKVENKLVGVGIGRVELMVVALDGDHIVKTLTQEVEIVKGDIKKPTTSVDGEELEAASVEIYDVQSIETNVAKVKMTEGSSKEIVANVVPSNATNKEISFKSMDTRIARVTDKGLVTGLSTGKTKIIITSLDDESVQAEVYVEVTKRVVKTQKTKPSGGSSEESGKSGQKEPEVKEIKVENITTKQSSIKLLEGKTIDIDYSITPEDAFNQDVLFTSSDTSVVTVTDGVIRAIKEGKATVTISSVDGSNKSATIEVTVEKPDLSVKKIKVESSKFSIITGETKKIKYTIEPANAENPAVTFTSANSAIATVDKDGNVKGIKSGTTTITVKSVDKPAVTAKVTVNVDYALFDSCASKKKAKEVTASDGKTTVKVYECIHNQSIAAQNMAITKDYIYYIGASYSGWCKKGNKYTVGKLTGKCLSNDYGEMLYVSGNKITRYTKSSVASAVNSLDLAGHAESFDVNSSNNIFVNYFPKFYNSATYGNGASSTGVAIINKFGSNKATIYPDTGILVYNDGKLKKMSTTETKGSQKYNDYIIEEGNSDKAIHMQLLAVDEGNDAIAILNRTKTSKNNKHLIIYKYSDFKKGTKTIVRDVYLNNLCDSNMSDCQLEGIELKGKYIYVFTATTINKAKHMTVFKVDSSKCPTTDTTTKCTSTSVSIKASLFGTDLSNGKVVGLGAVQGLSIYNNKVYLNVQSNAHADGKKYSSILLLDGFEK